jgi:hypothetical protein
MVQKELIENKETNGCDVLQARNDNLTGMKIVMRTMGWIHHS